jgi:hypothetical protein
MENLPGRGAIPRPGVARSNYGPAIFRLLTSRSVPGSFIALIDVH